MKRKIVYGAALAALVLASSAAAEPGNSGSRFTMSPVDGGFLRLDTETGAVAMCTQTGATWGCIPVEDRTPTAPSGEITKLEQENRELRDRIKTLEENLETKPPTDAMPPDGKMQLPTEQEVDQALDYLERVYKKFKDRLKEFDKPSPPPAKEPPPKGSL